MPKKLRPIHAPHEPIPGEIAARMTKPKPPTPLYQVVVETRDGQTVRVGPALEVQGVCDTICAEIRRAIAEGRERVWSSVETMRVA